MHIRIANRFGVKSPVLIFAPLLESLCPEPDPVDLIETHIKTVLPGMVRRGIFGENTIAVGRHNGVNIGTRIGFGLLKQEWDLFVRYGIFQRGLILPFV